MLHMAKKTVLAWSPIRELMKSQGAQVVARDAVDFLIKYLGDLGKNITTNALKLTRHAKRQKLTRSDVDLVIKMMLSGKS